MKKTTAHGRKLARGAGWAKGDALSVGIIRACKMPESEIAAVINPARESLQALREGRATETDWLNLTGVVKIGLAIEKLGVVRGLKSHFAAAHDALQAIYSRAMKSSRWTPGALHPAELQAIAEAVRLQKFQLDNLSRGELIAAMNAIEPLKTSPAQCARAQAAINLGVI